MNLANVTEEQQQRNLRDYLLLYNVLTEQCFDRCVLNMNRRQASMSENACVDNCTTRYVTFNQRLMFSFMEHQNLKQQAQTSEQQKLLLGQAASAPRSPLGAGLTGVNPAGTATQASPGQAPSDAAVTAS